MPRGTQELNGSRAAFVYEGITRCAWAFQRHSTSNTICNSLGPRQKTRLSLTTLTLQRLPPVTQDEFGLFPFRSPLLRE